ncbi:MAG: hypothetical protein ACRDUV_14035 [Pseudonocardiaceae bacterium]
MVRGDSAHTAALRAVTDVSSSLAHLVTDEQMAAGRRFGRYTAVCGDHVLAASLTAPESGYCKRCRAWRAGQ